MPKTPARPFTPLLLAGLAACAPAPTPTAPTTAEWATALAHADPAFGCGRVLEARLFQPPDHLLAGDPAARHRFLTEQRRRADADAEALVLELVDPALGAEVLLFLRSPAGEAMLSAEHQALAFHATPASDFYDFTAATFGDPGKVGHAMQPRMNELAAEMAAGAIPSPARIGIVIAAFRVHPDQAPLIAAFHASEDGRRWRDVRTRALARSQKRFLAIAETARRDGYLRRTLDDYLAGLPLPPLAFDDLEEVASSSPELLDLPLPEFLPVDPGESVILRIQADGQVLLEGRPIFASSTDEPAALHEALLEIRRAGLADGSLRTAPTVHEGRTTNAITNPIQVEIEGNTRWRLVAQVMDAASTPDIALWNFELKLVDGGR